MYKSRNEKVVIRVALAVILAGALGNLVDRTFYGVFYGYAPLFYGKVVDFLNVEFWDFTIFGHTYERWPIFNIADASVTVGVFLLIIFHRESDLKFGKVDDNEDSGKEHDLVTSLLEWNPVLITGIRLMTIWLLAYHLYHYYLNQIEITNLHVLNLGEPSNEYYSGPNRISH